MNLLVEQIMNPLESIKKDAYKDIIEDLFTIYPEHIKEQENWKGHKFVSKKVFCELMELDHTSQKDIRFLSNILKDYGVVYDRFKTINKVKGCFKFISLKEDKNKEQIDKCNELNSRDSRIIDSLNKEKYNILQIITKRKLSVADFVNSGSYRDMWAKEQGQYNNTEYDVLLKNMYESKQIKVKEFEYGKIKENGERKTRKYYYTRLSEEEVENMSELDVKSRLWQNLAF